MHTLSVIVPVLNEENAVGEILERLLKEKEKSEHSSSIEEFEIIVVNDGSTDRTAEVVASYPGVRLINHPSNRGYGAAIKTGFQYARGDLLAFLDADGTYPPEFLINLAETLIAMDAEIVVGSRLISDDNKMPLIRKIGNRFFAMLMSWASNKRVFDSASGLRVLRRDVLSKIYPLPDGLNFTPAMSIRALCENIKILEIPIPYDDRKGSSKLKVVKDGFRFFRSIMDTAKLYNPLKMFGSAGILFCFLGSLCSIPLLQSLLGTGANGTSFLFLVVSSFLLLSAGAIFISFGVLSNYVVSFLHGREVKKGLMDRIAFEFLSKRFDKVGLALIGVALLINGKNIFHFVTGLSYSTHWSILMLGTILFTLGLQAYTTSLLIQILARFREREIVGRQEIQRLENPPALALRELRRNCAVEEKTGSEGVEEIFELQRTVLDHKRDL